MRKKYSCLVMSALWVPLVAFCIAFGPPKALAKGSHLAPLPPGTPVDGLRCAIENVNQHYHAALALYLNGVPVSVPQYVGIPVNENIHAVDARGGVPSQLGDIDDKIIDEIGQDGFCLFPTHTHDESGLLHIESFDRRTYTLGQFFDIWAYTSLWDSEGTLASQFDISVDPTFVNALRSAPPGDVQVYVDGQEIDASVYDLTLSNHQIITVEIGTPLVPPLTDYPFPF